MVELPFGIHHNYDFAKPCSVRCLFFEEMKDASETCTKERKTWQIGKEGDHMTFMRLGFFKKSSLELSTLLFKQNFIFDEFFTFHKS